MPRTLVDIGCGDGQIAHLVAEKRPQLQISGIDILVRPQTGFPCNRSTAITLPLADQSVDVAMFVDVLHHTNDPLVLLREAKRVARQAILIKDHCKNGLLAGPTLRFMDGSATPITASCFLQLLERTALAGGLAELGLNTYIRGGRVSADVPWTQKIPL